MDEPMYEIGDFVKLIDVQEEHEFHDKIGKILSIRMQRGTI